MSSALSGSRERLRAYSAFVETHRGATPQDEGCQSSCAATPRVPDHEAADKEPPGG